MSSVKNASQAKAEIRNFLPQYLLDLNLIKSTKDKICCINPAHQDSTPSMNLVPSNQTILHCHGCGVNYDIFDVCHIVEEKPIKGKEFYEDTLKYLADKYGIELEIGEQSAEEIYRHQVYRAYSDAAMIVKMSDLSKFAKDEIDKRGWSLEFCQENDIGSIENVAKYKTLMLEKYEEAFLRSCGLFPESEQSAPALIFSPNSLIFTIKDHLGRPIAFSARKPDGFAPKYINSKESLIYNKSATFFGIHAYLSQPSAIRGPLFLFEGNADWATAQNAGLKSCASMCGTSFTQKHINFLLHHGIRDIIFCFDSDKAGVSRLIKIYTDKLSSLEGFNIRVVNLPCEEGEKVDPDSFIREKGLSEFLSLEKHSIFKWYLLNTDLGSDPVEVCAQSIPYIARESSAVKRDVMISELSAYTGMEPGSIQYDLDAYIQRLKDTDFQKKSEIAQDLVRQLQADPANIESLLERGQDRLERTVGIQNVNIYSNEKTLSDMLNVKVSQENPVSSMEFQLDHLQCFVDVIGCDWWGKWIQLGGKPNHGKTAIMAQMGVEILDQNDDTIVSILSLDDAKSDYINRMITYKVNRMSMKNGLLFDMNLVKNPMFYKGRMGEIHKELLSYREKAWEQMLGYIKEGRLIIKDSSDFTTMAQLNSQIKYIRKSNQSVRKLFQFIDSFNDLADESGVDEETSSVARRAAALKTGICVPYDIALITSVHYTKLQPMEKPSNTSVKGTVELQYQANLMMHVYSQLSDYQQMGKESSAPLRWTDPSYPDFVNPYVEIYVGKSKMSSFKGNLWFKQISRISYSEPEDQSVIDNLLVSKQEAPVRNVWRNKEYQED